MRQDFIKVRPNDFYASTGIGRTENTIPFFRYSNPQWNSFDKERSIKKEKELLSTINVSVRPLSSVIADAGWGDEKIDLMSIDTEGFELDVLQSFDISSIRPSLIILESIRAVSKASRDPAVSYLLDAGYQLCAHTGHDAFLLDQGKGS